MTFYAYNVTATFPPWQRMTSTEASTLGMARYRPPKHIREAIGKGRVTSDERKRLIIESTPDHLLVGTKAEKPRENWFVTAKSTHRTKYGWHYTRRMLNRVHNQHPSGCHVTYK